MAHTSQPLRIPKLGRTDVVPERVPEIQATRKLPQRELVLGQLVSEMALTDMSGSYGLAFRLPTSREQALLGHTPNK